ncbi:hypothetical protein EYF80_067496 [Liparis tanakae]|uniref:Uncharacterized protein n=1 Tax=Liparis tanakae TaxID=230148 RepID=A0A4Z2E1N3_9TELE|nr:hypothetical protein EYF80_067496 [Liparis tanakae]
MDEAGRLEEPSHAITRYSFSSTLTRPELSQSGRRALHQVLLAARTAQNRSEPPRTAQNRSEPLRTAQNRSAASGSDFI